MRPKEFNGKLKGAIAQLEEINEIVVIIGDCNDIVEKNKNREIVCIDKYGKEITSSNGQRMLHF